MTPLETAFVCAVLAMPNTWERHNPLPPVEYSDDRLFGFATRAVGAYIPKERLVVMPEGKDLSMAFWQGILAHEYAHYLGADEKRAKLVQSVCGRK